MSSPYPFEASDLNSVRFQTSNGIGYLIYFLPAPDFFGDYPEFAEDAMTFGIAVEENPLGYLPTDPRIGLTVGLVVREFFEQNPKGVLFYSIDNRDKKQLARKRLFDRWHKEEKEVGIERRVGSVGVPPNEIYFGLLFRSIHPHRRLIIDCVEAFLLFAKSK